MRSLTPLTALLVAPLALGLAACSGATAPQDDAATDGATDAATGPGHGAVQGAAELAEPALGLTTIDPTGQVTHLDLLDESVTELGTVGTPSAVTTDGRYLFAETDEGVEIVDSGAWTWDHVDHFHYYRAEPTLPGVVEGEGPATVATTNQSMSGGTGVFFEGSGDAVLLDTAALSGGSVDELFRLEVEPGAGMVVPVGSFALVTEGQGAATRVVGRTSAGDEAGATAQCPDAAGTITTRVGAVVGCSDGALLASVVDGELTIESVPYPADATAPPATSFDNREGRPTVAGLAGTEGIWVLDTRERAWSYLVAPSPLVHVTAVDDDDDHLLALAEDGRVLVLDGEDGAVLSETAPLVADSLAAGQEPVLVADQQRAYLSGPAERMLHEIDYADGARVARSFETATEPTWAAETGR